MREAFLYSRLDDGTIRCELCAHHCRIGEGARGFCRVRENRSGTLVTLSYDHVVATAVDPIEKKPLYHFHPGSRTFSLATVGCNFTCRFCQNHHISQYLKDSEPLPPGEAIAPLLLVDRAKREGCASVSFTYTEPTVFAELAYDVSRIAKSAGLETVFVTNGFMSAEFLNQFDGLISAANVDLKAFRDESYRRTIGGRLRPVLDSIEAMVSRGIWVELTTLLIPGFNDAPEELREMAGFIAGLSPDIPWHLSAFHPQYRMTDRPGTGLESLERAWECGREAGLRHVYLGNVRTERGSRTVCHACGEPLILRQGFRLVAFSVVNGHCPACGHALAGLF